MTISSEEIREALKEPVNAILQGIKDTLEKTDPELSADLVDRGMVLCGGGVLLRGLDQLIREETGLPVVIAEDPSPRYGCILHPSHAQGPPANNPESLVFPLYG